MQKFWSKTISVSEAVELAVKILKESIELKAIDIPIDRSIKMISSESIKCPIDLPPYNNSAVDGYAVRSIDTIGATQLNPVKLRVKCSMDTGDPPDKCGVLRDSEAVEVGTGAPLPEGADAVVMYEDSLKVGDYIEVFRQIAPFDNVNRAGDDFKAGEEAISEGTQLTVFHIGLLASLGLKNVRVYRPLKALILPTGSELVEPGELLQLGKKYSSTDYIVASLLREAGFIKVIKLSPTPDHVEEVKKALLKGLEKADLAITIGGSSIGSRDVVHRVIDSEGLWVFRGVALRPGRTTSLGLINRKPVFILSGNPVAAWAGFTAIIKPSIYKLYRSSPPVEPSIVATVSERIVNVAGYRSYVRVALSSNGLKYFVKPYMIHGSSYLSSIIKAHGYVVIPEEVEGYDVGEEVVVQLFTTRHLHVA
ncbi:MAG: molybdopterin molybdotransferase MoeA [Sulfolobales archaeon]|nr:molybdopterin molybdotransferase MoeA [Sulfolobales archaeon]MCX8198477.1 molybdopterin molybdotransferase MoeA [Sulfolobales archaeon]MDW8169552.1 molybdopterin molybdotransferase MoeA [Desulfurococcaceae archaeon]